MISADVPIDRQTAFDIAKAIAASEDVPLDFAAAYPLCRLVLELGGGPVNLRERAMAFLEKKVVKALERGGWLERSGDESPRAYRVASVLNLTEVPSAWTTTVSARPGRLRADLVTASDEAIAFIAGFAAKLTAADDATPREQDSSEDPSDGLLELAAGHPHVIVFARADVEACDMTHYARMIARLDTELGRSSFRQAVCLAFHGYDDDPRELFEVPEVLRFVDELVDLLPWGYFLAPGHGGLRLLLLCLARAEWDSAGVARIDPVRRVEVADHLYRRAMSAAFLAGLDADEVAEIRASISADLGVAFDDDQPAGEVFGELIDARIAELVGAPDDDSAPESSVQGLRDVWIQERIDAIVDGLGQVGTRLLGHARVDLGRNDLVVALLAARVESWLSWGLSQRVVLDRLDDLDVVVRRESTGDLLRDLVEMVGARVAAGGLGMGEPWRPDTGYLLLLEVWATEQRAVVGARRFADQLRTAWGETEPRALPYLTGIPARPLAAFRTIDDLYDADDEPAVALLISSSLEQPGVAERRQVVENAMNLAAIPHLAVMQRELDLEQGSARSLEAYASHVASGAAGTDPEVQIYGFVAQDAGERLREARQANAVLLQGLSSYEVSRLVVDADRRFQDAWLDAYVARCRTAFPREALRGRHGTYGTLPWWLVPASDDVADLVDEVLDAGNAGLALTREEEPFLTVSLVSPRGEGFYAFDYDVTLPEDLCELMLIGRSGRLGIDFDAERNGRRVRVGTVGVGVADEIADELLTTTTAQLRVLMGGADGLQPYREVRRVADGYFTSPRTSWSRAAEQFGGLDRLVD